MADGEVLKQRERCGHCGQPVRDVAPCPECGQDIPVKRCIICRKPVSWVPKGKGRPPRYCAEHREAAARYRRAFAEDRVAEHV